MALPQRCTGGLLKLVVEKSQIRDSTSSRQRRPPRSGILTQERHGESTSQSAAEVNAYVVVIEVKGGQWPRNCDCPDQT
jgi:hypothetical protein